MRSIGHLQLRQRGPLRHVALLIFCDQFVEPSTAKFVRNHIHSNAIVCKNPLLRDMNGLRKAEHEHALLLQTALSLRTELTALQSRLAAFSASRTVTPTTTPTPSSSPTTSTTTTQARTNPVLGKLAAVLECAHRPLREGEVPKRRGQSTVYEATGNINLSVGCSSLHLYHLLDTASVTIKHDGTCCYITEGGQYCKRLDIRPPKPGKKGKAPKPQKLPAEAIILCMPTSAGINNSIHTSTASPGGGGSAHTSSSGGSVPPDVCWIPVASTGNEGKYHKSAIKNGLRVSKYILNFKIKNIYANAAREGSLTRGP